MMMILDGCMIGNRRREDEGYIHIDQAVRVVSNHIAKGDSVNSWYIQG